VGRAHKKRCLKCLSFDAKKLNRMYKQSDNGYTITRKSNRQQEIHKVDNKILHIELLSEEFKIP